MSAADPLGHGAQEDVGTSACTAAAAAHGISAEKAELCDSGMYACRACPFTNPKPATAQTAGPRDAAVYFRDGKLVAVETAAGTFTLNDLMARRLLSFTDGMILSQLAGRVDTLIGQLAKP